MLMLADLQRSGLAASDGARMGLQPLDGNATRELTKGRWNCPAYRIPYFNVNGSPDPAFYRLRKLETEEGLSTRAVSRRTQTLEEPAWPIIESEPAFKKDKTRDFKYYQPPDTLPRIYYPPLLKDLTWATIAADTKITIYIIEGEKKAAAMAKRGYACIGIGGVWSFKSKRAMLNLIPDFKGFNWEGRVVVIVWDSDATGRVSLQAALNALALALMREGATVLKKTLPAQDDGSKNGADDYLLTHNNDEFDEIEAEPVDLNRELLWFNDNFTFCGDSLGIIENATGIIRREKDFHLLTRERRIVIPSAIGVREVAACEEWLKWSGKTRVKGAVYLPRPVGGTREVAGFYNFWKGRGVAKAEKGDVRPFLRLLKHLTKESEPWVFQYSLQWLAYPIQFPYLKPLVQIAYITGWRAYSELLSRLWKHVDFENGWLRLDPGETKNGEGREFPFTAELRVVLEAQREHVKALERALGRVIPQVFVHPDGSPIKDFRNAWATATKAAGVPARLMHDFRRAAVRNLERAGVPRSAAMTGDKTEAVYRRYAIVDQAMLQEGVAKLAVLHASERS